MSNDFTLTIIHKGEEKHLEGRLLPMGYTHKFLVLVDGVELFYEPDEEGEYRARINPEEMKKGEIDRGLLKLIQEKLKEILA